MLGDRMGVVYDTPLAEALSERYLSYALSTIMSRSLPDVRDGLKPVHRRLIHAMRQLKLDPGAGFKKCARVVGDVIGKYHPHGDVAVYEALVRLAQDFTQRYPLIEGQGNFGNVDGDNAAAMRYTESRLTAVAAAMLEGVDEDAVDFHPTYDNEDSEPAVLPGAFPNLLANGAAGIAVGMATNIPPHNVGEICAAAAHLIQNPDADSRVLSSFVKGPDFPTGGVIAEDPETLHAAYETGRGSIRVRARWAKVDLKGGQWHIIITEIPYQLQKSRLIEQVAQLLADRKLPLLGNIRDESTEQIRIVLEPKSRNVDPEVLMASLFRATALEQRFAFNMNVLDADRTPRLMGLREMLRAWLDHRHDVLLRRTHHRLTTISRRIEILDGYLAVFLDIDKLIGLIRTEDEPKAAIIQAFSLTDVQADAILNMRLRSLRRLEEMELRKEHKALSTERKGLNALLTDPRKRWVRIEEEVSDISRRFGDDQIGRRRTAICVAPDESAVAAEALIEREPIMAILSDRGWIRAVKGGSASNSDLRFKEGDRLRALLACETTDKISLFATNGRFYTLRAADLPRGRGDGQAIRLLLDLSNEDDIVTMFVADPLARYLLVSSAGRGFIAAGSELSAEKRTGKQLLTLRGGEEAALCCKVTGGHVAVIGQNRKLLVFPSEQIPEMAKGAGVILQKYKDGGFSDAKFLNLADGLSWKTGERTRTETNISSWISTRGQAGRLPPNGFPRSGKFGDDGPC